jgi:trans-aconitate methyltransferase
MLAQARAAYPKLELHQGDGRDFDFPEPFDAVFTNATLHWIPEADAVLAAVHRNLKPGGRFVGEFGGHGNVATLHQSLAQAATELALPAFEPHHTHFFPTPADYATRLERAGFEVNLITLFDRPTPLEGPHGGRNWLQQFCAFYLENLTDEQREAVLDRAEEIMRPKLYRDGGWFADYRRLRFVGRR